MDDARTRHDRFDTTRETQSMDAERRTLTTDRLTNAVETALTTIDANLGLFADAFPDDTTVDGVYRLRERWGMPDGANVGWTTSFWPGMLWLAYEATGRERYRDAASRFVRSFVRRLDERVDLDTHDLGFLYTLSCVVAWRQTGDRVARDAALSAANFLANRFLEPAGIIQAWGDLSNPEQRGRTIIDSLMNTPLLFWAAAESGEERFRTIAVRHAQQLRDHILRDEGSTFHTFYWDPETGEPLRGATEQGHDDDSCWARGQAWGIYGFAINYRLSGDVSLLDASRRCADYYLRHLPADRVPYWDLALSDGGGESHDSSAAAIAATGLMELASQLGDDPGADEYHRVGVETLASLARDYSTGGATGGRALIERGVYDAPKNVGVDEGTLWGDYFYLESLIRIALPDWTPYW